MDESFCLSLQSKDIRHMIHKKIIVTLLSLLGVLGMNAQMVDPVHFTVTLPSTGTYNNAYDAINALPVYVKMSSSPTPIQLTVNPGQPA